MRLLEQHDKFREHLLEAGAPFVDITAAAKLNTIDLHPDPDISEYTIRIEGQDLTVVPPCQLIEIRAGQFKEFHTLDCQCAAAREKQISTHIERSAKLALIKAQER